MAVDLLPFIPGPSDLNRRIPRSEWLLAFAICLLVCLGLTYACGRDLNWDQFNYHLYAGLSVFQDRLAQDFFAASVQSYFNPLVYAPFYWMVHQGWHSFAIASVHAAIHALNPLLLYVIARSLMPPEERYPRWVAGVCALLGCASTIFVAELGTTFMDLTTSVPVLLAAWLLMRAPPRASVVWLAGGLLGVSVGLKLTNVVFALAAVISAVVVSRSISAAVAAGLRLSAGMAVGFVASFGVWGWKLYQQFGSPVFPYFNAIFKAPDYAPSSMRFDRFVPVTLDEWLLFPIRLVEMQSWIYTETMAPDMRPIVVLVVGMLAILAMGWRRARAAVGPLTPAVSDSWNYHGVTWLSAFLVVSVLAWTQTSANGRYGLVWLMLLGPMAAIVFRAVFAANVSRVLLLLLLAAQSFHMMSAGNPRWNPQHWSPSWYEAEVPEKLTSQPFLYLSLGSLSNSFVAAFVHPDSAFVNLVGQHSLSFIRPGGERLRSLLEQHPGRTRMLAGWRSDAEPPLAGSLPAARFNHVLERVGLEVDFEDCALISTDGGELLTGAAAFMSDLPSVPADPTNRKVLLSCALLPRAARADRLQDEPRLQVEEAFAALEARCPSLFRPSHAVVEFTGGVYAAYYMETGVTLSVNKGLISYALERQPVDTRIGSLVEWPAAVRDFTCKRPRNGSRDF